MVSIKAGLLAAMFAAVPTAWAATADVVTVYKNATCGCCSQWAKHLEAAGFKVEIINSKDVGLDRKRLGMPDQYGSCHTAKVGGYVVEGHVPATDLQRLLKQHPQAIGLAAPGMPAGSPGMEGTKAVPYDVLLIKADGSNTPFAHH